MAGPGAPTMRPAFKTAGGCSRPYAGPSGELVMAPLAALRRDADRDENEVATAEAGKYHNVTGNPSRQRVRWA
jgi:hypothetical protein